MEEKKSAKSFQMLLIILLLVVVICFVAFRFLYTPMNEERNKLLKDNYDLNVRYIELWNMKTLHEQEFKDSIDTSRVQISKEMTKYSAGNKPEKSIMLINKMINEIGVTVPSITFSAPSVVTSVEMPQINEIGDGNYTIDYYNVELLGEQIFFDISCTYEELKMVSDFINANKEKMNIGSIDIAYDNEIGKLTGNISLNIYTAIGDGREYEEPVITDIRLGGQDIFK